MLINKMNKSCQLEFSFRSSITYGKENLKLDKYPDNARELKQNIDHESYLIHVIVIFKKFNRLKKGLEREEIYIHN